MTVLRSSIDGSEGPKWYWNDVGEPCWFRDGLPSINGKCVWCGRPSEGHRPAEPNDVLVIPRHG